MEDKDRKRVLVLECVPKRDKMDEGIILYKFMSMTNMDLVGTIRVTHKRDLLNIMCNKSVMRQFGFVHISAHGNEDADGEPILELPNGYLYSLEFPANCFKGKTVTFSACRLCRSSFIDTFMDQTGARYVVGPKKDVSFDDSAVWFINFYYLTLSHGYRPFDACYRVNEQYDDKIRGAFNCWR